MQFSRDKDGAPLAVAEGKEEEQALANFLQGDVQDDDIIGKELLDMADEVARGALGRYEFNGNVHELILSDDEAIIRNSLDDKDDTEQRIPLADFRRALSGWLTFIG